MCPKTLRKLDRIEDGVAYYLVTKFYYATGEPEGSKRWCDNCKSYVPYDPSEPLVSEDEAQRLYSD